MKLLGIVCAASVIAASQSPAQRVFVEQKPDAVGRVEVLMLDGDGRFSSVSSIPTRGRGKIGHLATDRGYWLHCGRWRASPDGGIRVHRQLVESFSYFPPPHPGSWEIRTLTLSSTGVGQQLREHDRVYSIAATAPIDRKLLLFIPTACAASWTGENDVR